MSTKARVSVLSRNHNVVLVVAGDAALGKVHRHMETLHKRTAERADIVSRVSERRTARCTSAAQRRIRKNIFWGRWVVVKNKPALKATRHF